MTSKQSFSLLSTLNWMLLSAFLNQQPTFGNRMNFLAEQMIDGIVFICVKTTCRNEQANRRHAPPKGR